MDQDERVEGPLDAVREALIEPRALSLDDVADAAGIDVDRLGRLFAASGRLRERYGDGDLQYARTLASLLDLIPVEILERAGRVRSRHLSSVVVNDLAVVRDAVIQPMLAGGISVDDVADQLAASSAELVPLIAGLLALDYRDILVRFLERDEVIESSRTGSSEISVAIGFVDLVGFTQLSAHADPEGVGEVLRAFEDLVHDTARRYDEVMVAKFIGDAAMFVCGEIDPLARALHDVVTDGDAMEGTGRRAGLAHGPVIAREGDYYGATVNYAARLTDLARPHTVLAAKDTAKALGPGWRTSLLGTVEIRGIGRTRPIRLRWDEDR